MVDAYDVLNIDLDADEAEIKKAFKRLSLIHHPDKASAAGIAPEVASAKFNEVKTASDVLLDADRRKIYDTFGLDLGEDKPDVEIWNLGVSAMLSPIGGFTFKTFAMRLVLWTVSWRWIGYLVFLASLIFAALYGINVTIWGIKLRSQEGVPFAIGMGILCGVTVVVWLSTVLADGVGVLYLTSEVLDVAMLIENWKYGVGAALASLFVGWLVQNWWFWILALQVVLVVVVLIAVSVASELLRLWLDNVKTQHGEKLKEQRRRVRRERKALQDEVARLKAKLEVSR